MSPKTVEERTASATDPAREAIRRIAVDNGLPVNAITQVRVLDLYFY